MKHVLFIMADPDRSGFLNKSILPTIKLAYSKNGFKTHVINIYQDGFNPMSVDDFISLTFVKSYKHYIKISDHIHILTPTRFGGLSVATEGFINNIILREYFDKNILLKKKAFFHVFHQDKDRIFWFNSIYLRLKLLISKAFMYTKVYQYDLNMINNRNGILQKIKAKTLKEL